MDGTIAPAGSGAQASKQTEQRKQYVYLPNDDRPLYPGPRNGGIYSSVAVLKSRAGTQPPFGPKSRRHCLSLLIDGCIKQTTKVPTPTPHALAPGPYVPC